ncbi:MAG TPA: DNA-protecting protein DprA [Coriobacteriia bacterium]|nr:MAG: SMF family protein [Actinobacteria bacterium 66_15]HAL29142.1 DNA-protecting protein DprA [Coriobacteriia bacterium]
MRGGRFVLRLGTPGYPELLARTPDPPERLYGVGDPGALVPGLAIVGSRKATPYGLRCARMFAEWAARSGITVISGAAVGCDTEAHRTALASGGPSVAVLGCGPDIDYPRRSAQELATMRAEHAVVSEYPFGHQPTRWTFVRRNRIIAGLSHAVLVVEAGLPSGTFSTADAALDAGREVVAVPGSIFSPESRGANRLIRQGAAMATDPAELAALLGWEGTLPATTAVCTDPAVRALTADPMRPDDLARALGVDIVSMARTLGSLEAQGLIARYPDGRYGVT